MSKYLKWSAKKIDGKYGEFFSVSINKEAFNELQDNKGYVSLWITEKKQPDEWGNTHSIIIPENKPKQETLTDDDVPL